MKFIIGIIVKLLASYFECSSWINIIPIVWTKVNYSDKRQNSELVNRRKSQKGIDWEKM